MEKEHGPIFSALIKHDQKQNLGSYKKYKGTDNAQKNHVRVLSIEMAKSLHMDKLTLAGVRRRLGSKNINIYIYPVCIVSNLMCRWNFHWNPINLYLDIVLGKQESRPNGSGALETGPTQVLSPIVGSELNLDQVLCEIGPRTERLNDACVLLIWSWVIKKTRSINQGYIIQFKL